MRPSWMVLLLAACGGGQAAVKPPVMRIPCAQGVRGRQTSAEEMARLGEQLHKTDPSLGPDLVVQGVVREDLDGDGRPDAAFAVLAGDLGALLVDASSFPGRLRILQFSDGEPIELVGTIDLEPDRPGIQLVVRSLTMKGPTLEIVRGNGEVIGHAVCAEPTAP